MKSKLILIGDRSYTVHSDDNYLNEIGPVFEPHMVEIFKRLVKPTDKVADIGANIGLTTLLFSNIANEVYSFEPSPSTYKILDFNIASAGINNVKIFNIGIGEKEESLSITFSKDNRSGGFISDMMQLDENMYTTESIKCERLDDFFSRQDVYPDFIKIDVEGFESNVLKGGIGILKEKKPTVVLELNHFCLNVFRRTSLPDFFDFLKSVFPYIYAVDTDNRTILNITGSSESYYVMYNHIINNSFPNIVCGFDESLKDTMLQIQNIASAKHISPSTQLVSKANGKIKIIHFPENIECDKHFELYIELYNLSNFVWCSYGDHPVFLSYHWCAANGDMVAYEGVRSPLSGKKLLPCDSELQKMIIQAPSKSGNYKLIVTLVQEYAHWFEDIDFHPASLTIEIL